MDDLPKWHSRPPAPGVYVTREADRASSPNGHGFCVVDDPAHAAERYPYLRWFGPIPADEPDK